MDKQLDTGKNEYVKPKVHDYGDLTQLTAGAKTGNFTDATFPVGTPMKSLTFSG